MTATTEYPTKSWKALVADFELLKRELIRLTTKRKVYRAHNDSLKDHEVNGPTALVHAWLRENYVDSMFIGLRRLLDRDTRTLSLVTVLRRLESHADEITFENHLKVWGNDPDLIDTHEARKLYAKHSADGATLDTTCVRRDVVSLRKSNARLIRFINNRIAHWNPSQLQEPALPLTYDELHLAFDEIGRIFNKYYVLLTASSVLEFEAMLPYGFERAFKGMVDSA